ncbi:MAG: acetyl-CoA carboxylase carboxyl transferase subunit alpha [Candidatus Duberdicusella sinuisediminis]|nr:MAG: acetyl-CoA carboxylase carboxyl transferase subunit alpha [Candidatus Omnitrophota bacterium]
MNILEFERPIIELEERIKELKNFSSERHIDLSSEVEKLEKKLENLKKEIYGNLTAWQRIQIARHPQRLYTLDYINRIMTDFIEIHGDRVYGDDKAIVTGFAKLEGERLVVIGHQKGRDTKENIERNFGCAHPEGYRKALRIMKLAGKFKLPIIILIDTPGAYPGIGAEQRGQAQAIAENICQMFGIKTPIICCVIGEGGSGGALGIGVGDKVLMLENAYYSVISPEGCSAILWKDSSKVREAAEALKLTSFDLLKFGIIDEIVPEPLGGVHKDVELSSQNLQEALLRNLKVLQKLSLDQLLKKRYEKFRKIGVFKEESL